MTTEPANNDIEYFLKLLYVNKAQTVGHCLHTKSNDLNVSIQISGEKCDTDQTQLSSHNHVKQQENYFKQANENEKLATFRVLLKNVGKVKSLKLVHDSNEKSEFFVKEIRLEIPYRNELLIFPIDTILNEKETLLLEPNLKPGQTGVHYAITTHTDCRIISKAKSRIFIQIIGDKCSTEYIPLLHSQTNKHAFLNGKRDVFYVTGPDVGHIKKVRVRNEDEETENTEWNLVNLEIRTISDGHVYSFDTMRRCLLETCLSELKLLSNTEVEYEVILRTFEADNSRKHSSMSSYQYVPDVYFQLKGTKGKTKKIFLNTYELKRKDSEGFKERYFEFKSEDIGKIEKLTLSLNENNNQNDYLCIDFIEVRIPSRSEAYKFPVERAIGEYVDDGKCDLELDAWKHPEKLHYIDYELITESGPDNKVEEGGCCFLRIHGTHGATAKIKFIDTDFDEEAAIDLCEFKAPDCGKITKIELFYQPKSTKSAWQIESIEIKVKARNEAYRFPVCEWLNSEGTYLQLEPWRKPSTAH